MVTEIPKFADVSAGVSEEGLRVLLTEEWNARIGPHLEGNHDAEIRAAFEAGIAALRRLSPTADLSTEEELRDEIAKALCDYEFSLDMRQLMPWDELSVEARGEWRVRADIAVAVTRRASQPVFASEEGLAWLAEVPASGAFLPSYYVGGAKNKVTFSIDVNRAIERGAVDLIQSTAFRDLRSQGSGY